MLKGKGFNIEVELLDEIIYFQKFKDLKYFSKEIY